MTSFLYYFHLYAGDVTGYSAVDTGYVPVNAYSNYGTRPIGGTYNSVPNSGPTVIVNVPGNLTCFISKTTIIKLIKDYLTYHIFDVNNRPHNTFLYISENEYDNTLGRGYSRTNVFGVPANRRRI